ncbi:DNA-binding protein [Duganella vulcania]|uniref:Transcriptional regulator n=1 Tax=Duganella vulcania TaxID=2692166 RepID=A0A845GFW0_9BURK|nr:DNA-binding protein [Duganella vulcania]MYM92282.1 transcriptional regulator [Duganella vulcania]
MPRPPIATPDKIRSTVLAMLAEAHDVAPATSERFRRIVSVRKLMDRLGGGNPATVGRALNEIESEIVISGLANAAIPDIPTDIAVQMRGLWQSAVSAQLDDVLRLKAQAQQSIDEADASVKDAQLRNEMLREELAALRAQLAGRDAELAQTRAELSTGHAQLAALQGIYDGVQSELHALRQQSDTTAQAHARELASAQERYEGLSKQLLQETAHQRQSIKQDQERISSQLKFAERRIAALEDGLAHAQAEAASERGKCLTAVSEANTLKAINSSQRMQLDELIRATLAKAPAPKQRAPSAPAATSKRAAPRRKPAK